MFPRLLLLTLLATTSFLLNAQSFKAYVKAGDEAFARKDYQAAMLHYGGALSLRPEAAPVNQQYALVALRFHAYQQSITHFKKVLDSPDADQYPQSLLGLGEAYQHIGDYNQAAGYLKGYLKRTGTPSSGQSTAKRLLEQCEWALKQSPDTLIKVSHLGRSVNTDYSEFAPVLRADTFYYSSFRYEREKDDYEPSRRITKVLSRKGGSRGRPMRRGFNDDQKHTAHTAFNLTSNRIYFTLCDYISASEIRCRIAYRERDSRGRWKTKTNFLPNSINREGHTATHPNLGYDSLAKTEILYFVSESEAGDLDLFYATLDSTGQVGKPIALTEINTAQDDLTPFFDSPSQTLYFSSAGYQNFGGYDIFKSVKTNKGWSAPENLGLPVNSSYHDLYYSLTEDTTRAFLASNRTGAYFLDDDFEACCHDLYQVQQVTPAPITPPTAEIPIVPDPVTPPVPEPDPEPETLQDFLPLALYFDNDEPDRRTRKTTTQKTYGESFRSYKDKQGEYLRAFTSSLTGNLKEEAAFAVESFFEAEVEKGNDFLGKFSQILLKRLEQGDTVEIFMKGYTSPRAKRDYNLALSKRRISSVRNHFRTYQNEIFLPFLDSGQLMLSERPFGEAEAANTISDALDDLRNSIYHPDAARERRVEIVEIRD
ncbi:MAG: hypothetical protein HRU12_02185 [Phaeodactylibacter sp.]|nr:hypothetical protein [Phaeodactylibacter sp.]